MGAEGGLRHACLTQLTKPLERAGKHCLSSACCVLCCPFFAPWLSTICPRTPSTLSCWRGLYLLRRVSLQAAQPAVHVHICAVSATLSENPRFQRFQKHQHHGETLWGWGVHGTENSGEGARERRGGQGSLHPHSNSRTQTCPIILHLCIAPPENGPQHGGQCIN